MKKAQPAAAKPAASKEEDTIGLNVAFRIDPEHKEALYRLSAAAGQKPVDWLKDAIRETISEAAAERERLAELARKCVLPMRLTIHVAGDEIGRVEIGRQLHKRLQLGAHLNARSMADFIRFCLEYTSAPTWELDAQTYRSLNTDEERWFYEQAANVT